MMFKMGSNARPQLGMMQRAVSNACGLDNKTALVAVLALTR